MASRTVRLASVGLLITGLVYGCSESGDGPQSSSSSTSSSGTSSQGGGDGGDAQGGAGATATTSGTGGGNVGGSGGGVGGGGGSVPQLSIDVVAPRAVVEKDDEGKLKVECVVLSDGAPYAGEYTPKVTISPNTGVTQTGDEYEFDEYGIYTAKCEVSIEGKDLSASADIAVLNEAIDPKLAAVANGVAGVNKGLLAIMASDGGADQELIDAINDLAVVRTGLQPSELTDLDDVLRDLPGGYPTPSELQNNGITANADDAALPGKLTEVDTAISQLAATFAGFDPANLTMADVLAAKAHTATLQKLADEMELLKPTAHGTIATSAQAAGFVKNTLAPAMLTIADYMDANIRAQAPGLFPKAQASAGVKTRSLESSSQLPSQQLQPKSTLKFGLISMCMSMSIQSNLQTTLITKIYGKYLDELDASINNLILTAAIDYLMPPNPQGPVIDLLQASASLSFAKVGYPSWVDGSGFNPDPTYNLFFVVGDGWQTTISAIFTACGISEANTIPEAVETINDCVNDVQNAVQNLTIIPKSVSPGIFGSPQGLDLGNFPAACSGALPLAIAIIPVNLGVGRGPSYLTNCIK